MNTQVTDIPANLTRYANDLAYVAEEPPATNLAEFIDQLHTASCNIQDAGFDGFQNLDTAATYLNDAATSTGQAQQTLLTKATEYLRAGADLLDEYRDAAGD